MNMGAEEVKGNDVELAAALNEAKVCNADAEPSETGMTEATDGPQAEAAAVVMVIAEDGRKTAELGVAGMVKAGPATGEEAAEEVNATVAAPYIDEELAATGATGLTATKGLTGAAATAAGGKNRIDVASAAGEERGKCDAWKGRREAAVAQSCAVGDEARNGLDLATAR